VLCARRMYHLPTHTFGCFYACFDLDYYFEVGVCEHWIHSHISTPPMQDDLHARKQTDVIV
jgi:hypothetical protein